MRKLRAWRAWRGLPLHLRISLAWRGLMPVTGATPPALLPVLGEGNLIRQEQYRLSAPWEKKRAVFSSTLSQEGALQEGLLLGTLLGQDSFYGAPGESSSEMFDYQTAPLWAARTRKRKPNEGHIDTDVPLQLLGQDRFYGGPGQAITFGITERQRSYPPLHQHHQIYKTEVVGLPTGALWDAPNPLVRLPQSEYQDSSDVLKIKLIGQDTFYGDAGQAIAFDWTQLGTPKLPIRIPQSDYALQDAQGTVLGSRDPFIPIDQSLTGQRTYAVFAEIGLGSSRNRILLVGGRRSRLLLLR